MRPNVTTAILVLALAALFTPGAAADTDLALPNRSKVTGTIEPADEVETHRVTLPAGAVYVIYPDPTLALPVTAGAADLVIRGSAGEHLGAAGGY